MRDACGELSIILPGLVPGIHVLFFDRHEGVDGRDKPGNDHGRTR
jgi:hypothetical protein